MGEAPHTWTPEGNLAAIVNAGYRYYIPIRSVGPTASAWTTWSVTVSLTHGLVYWAVVLA